MIEYLSVQRNTLAVVTVSSFREPSRRNASPVNSHYVFRLARRSLIENTLARQVQQMNSPSLHNQKKENDWPLSALTSISISSLAQAALLPLPR